MVYRKPLPNLVYVFSVSRVVPIAAIRFLYTNEALTSVVAKHHAAVAADALVKM